MKIEIDTDKILHSLQGMVSRAFRSITMTDEEAYLARLVAFNRRMDAAAIKNGLMNDRRDAAFCRSAQKYAFRL